MAIALNTPYKVDSRSAVISGVRSRSAQPAAVWDARRNDFCGEPSAFRSSHVRTLSVENRTFNSVNGARETASVPERTGDRYDKSRANRANYLVGAVFGCALFVGTVFTGLSGISPEADVPGGVSSPETVQAVIAR